jgi:hypothetical protein
MLLRLRNSPRAATFRRYLAYLDVVVIVLLVVGSVTRTSNNDFSSEQWTDGYTYDYATPSNAHMLVFTFSLLMA